MIKDSFIISHAPNENNMNATRRCGEVEFFYGGLYIPCVDGVLSYKLIRCYFRNYLAIIRSKKKTVIHLKNGCDIALPAGVIFCGGNTDVSLSSAQLLIITPELFSNHLEITFSDGIIKNPYEDITIALFDMVKNFKSSINEILAIANLAAMATHKKNIEPECNVLKDIKNNYLNHDYGLDDLCQNIHISRRKAQYILNGHGTSFLNELKRLRVLKIKNLISSTGKHSENRFKRISYYSFKSGFKSPTAAKRDFKMITGMDVADYIKQLEAC